MKPTTYQITVRGRMSDALVGAFDGLAASRYPRHTVLRGKLADQAALYGVLGRIEAFGLELVDVRRAVPTR
jgi:hypothetical protein